MFHLAAPEAGSSGPACMVSGCLASATHHVSLTSVDHQPRLCDSVQPASPQVHWHPLHTKEVCEGCYRAGSFSRYEDRVLQLLLNCTQERWWVTSNLGPACVEPGPSLVNVQHVDAETLFKKKHSRKLWVHPSPRLVCRN